MRALGLAVDLLDHVQRRLLPFDVFVQRRYVRGIGIAPSERVGDDTVVDDVALRVEQRGVVRQSLIKRVDGGHRGGVRDDEIDVLALDPEIILRIPIENLLTARFVRRIGRRGGVQSRQRVERGDASVVEPVEFHEDFRVGRAFDRIVVRQVAERVDGDFLPGRDDQRDHAAVAQQVEERGRGDGQFDPETEIPLARRDGRIDYGPLLRSHHFQQNRVVGQTGERAVDPGFLALIARPEKRGGGEEQKNFFHSLSHVFKCVRRAPDFPDGCLPSGGPRRFRFEQQKYNNFPIYKTSRRPFIVYAERAERPEAAPPVRPRAGAAQPDAQDRFAVFLVYLDLEVAQNVHIVDERLVEASRTD